MKPPADAGPATRTRRTPQWPPSRRLYPAPRCCRAWSSTPTRPGRGYGRSISIVGTGPRPRAFDLETETLENLNFRTVARSDAYLQVTLMSIPVNGDIGLAKHPDTDQFIRLDRGRAQMGPGKDDPTFDRRLVHPRSSRQLAQHHQPQHHTPGKVHQTKEIADTDTDDKPADWSVQPNPVADQHA